MFFTLWQLQTWLRSSMAQKKLAHILDSCQALVPNTTVHFFSQWCLLFKMLIPDHSCLLEIPGKKVILLNVLKLKWTSPINDWFLTFCICLCKWCSINILWHQKMFLFNCFHVLHHFELTSLFVFLADKAVISPWLPLVRWWTAKYVVHVKCAHYYVEKQLGGAGGFSFVSLPNVALRCHLWAPK